MAEGTHLERSSWLDAALDSLYEEGEPGVRVEPLARRLGVTKGSFYHHFRDRSDLLQAMIDRWTATQEALVESLKQSAAGSTSEQIEDLLEFTSSKDSRHDVGMRAWALYHSGARRALQTVDRLRLEYVESLFLDLGFKTDEARLRARLLYFYQVGEYTLSVRDRESLRQRLRELRYKLLTST